MWDSFSPLLARVRARSFPAFSALPRPALPRPAFPRPDLSSLPPLRLPPLPSLPSRRAEELVDAWEAALSGGLLPGSQFADLDGPVHYVEYPGPTKDAPVLLCVHGLGGSHVNWFVLGPLLAKRFHVYALDLYGHGRTPRLGRAASLPGMDLLLARFVQEVISRPVFVLGNSLGGTLALRLAALVPSDVLGLVLVGPASPRPRMLPEFLVARLALAALVPAAPRLMARRRERLGTSNWNQSQLTLAAAEVSRVSQEAQLLAVELIDVHAAGPGAEVAFCEAARSLAWFLLHPSRFFALLQRVDKDVLVVHGDRDRLVPVEASFALWAARPDWSISVLPGVGHIPHFEVPEELADLVLEWFDALPAPSLPSPAPSALLA